MYARLSLLAVSSLAIAQGAAGALLVPGLHTTAQQGAQGADDEWSESDPRVDVLRLLQAKRFAEAAELLRGMGEDPAALYLMGSLQRFGSLGEPDLVAARKALELSAQGGCVDAALALSELAEDRYWDLDPADHAGRDAGRDEAVEWLFRAIAMGFVPATVDAAMLLVPTGEVQPTLDPRSKASAARAIAWSRIAKKAKVEGAGDLEEALIDSFGGAVEASVAIQAKLEARIESERAKIGQVAYLDLPEGYFLPEGSAAGGEHSAAFEEAFAHYDEERYEAAFSAFLPMAEAGDVEAAFYVGRIHEMGFVGEVNGDLAERWYLRSSEAGIHAATANLGYMYLEGRGVPKNPGKATDCFLVAAYGGNLEGAVNVGFAHGTGTGRSKDLVEAHAWYSIAADYGEEAAARNRGLVERDMSQRDLEAAKARRTELELELSGQRAPKVALPVLRRDPAPTQQPASRTAGQVAAPSVYAVPAAPANDPAPAPADAGVSTIQLKDELMGGMPSHELRLPSGWDFDGQLNWNPQDAMAHASVEGVAWTERGAEVRFLPSGSFTYFSEMPGQNQGQNQGQSQGVPPRPSQGDWNGGAMFLDPGADLSKGPETFVTRIVLGSFRPNAQELRVLSVGEAAPVSRYYQGLMEPMVQQMASNGQQPGVESSHLVSCPVIRVRYVEDGRNYEEEFTMMYARFDMAMEFGPGQKMTSALWYVFDARGLRAPEGTLDAQLAEMRQVAQSLRPTQSWAAMLDHIRATFYGNPDRIQQLQGLDYAGTLAKLKEHVVPLLGQSAKITAQAAQSWADLTERFDALDRAWAESMGVGAAPRQPRSPYGNPAPADRRGGYRIR